MAVKAFRLDLLPEDVARLADGVRRLVGTAGYLAAGLEGTTAYVAMDYHAAETFDVALRHLAPAPLETALPILRALADRIDAAWAAGPIFGHGALHPRDVFVTPGTDELYVTGFGIVPALEAIGARPPVRRPYTAPERAMGEAWDVRADVFSLGAIAHELLTGRRPAGPGEQDGTLPTSIAPEVRVQIRRVLSKALAELPTQRFSSAREFVDTLSDPSTLADLDAPDAVARPLVDLPLAPMAPVIVAPPAPVEAPATLAPPAVAPAAPVATVSPAPSAGLPSMPPPTPPRRVRARHAPEPAASARVSEPAVIPDDLPLDIGAPPLPIEPLLRPSSSAPARNTTIALPPPFPWAAMAAVFVASAVIFFVIGYQWALRGQPPGGASPQPQVTANPPALSPPPAPTGASAANDTEVAVSEVAPTQPATPPAPTAAKVPALPGRVLVRSTPTGAVVTVNGKPAGRTPLTVRDLSLATHTVVVSRPGFQSETRRVALTRRAPSATLTVTLKADRPAAARGATTGAINVDSRPRGAQVTIDGRAVGVTPLSVPGFAAGAHAVRVELTGHKPVVTTVTVKAGETARVAVTLEQR